MAKPIKDVGMIQLMLTRMNAERIPEALRLWEKVSHGECLSEWEIQSITEVLDKAHEALRLARKYPEYEDLVGRLAALYADIATQAVKNEQRASGLGG